MAPLFCDSFSMPQNCAAFKQSPVAWRKNGCSDRISGMRSVKRDNIAVSPSLAEQMRSYEDKWVAVVLDPEERIVGSGLQPLEARLEAERDGYHGAILLWVPPVGAVLAP